MPRTDILLENDDLQIVNGDLEMGIADGQNVMLLVRLHPGNLKQFPLLGVGESRLINGPFDGELRREIQLQLEGDGYRLRNLQFGGEGKINLEFDPA